MMQRCHGWMKKKSNKTLLFNVTHQSLNIEILCLNPQWWWQIKKISVITKTKTFLSKKNFKRISTLSRSCQTHFKDKKKMLLVNVKRKLSYQRQLENKVLMTNTKTVKRKLSYQSRNENKVLTNNYKDISRKLNCQSQFKNKVFHHANNNGYPK